MSISKAKADEIELTGLTAYSTRYTGYPITKGTLTVNVHYTLDQGNLTADNHIFIDQLTFGDRIANSTATNLPIRLAVSLLKNSKGEIDVDVPVSGSLKDSAIQYRQRDLARVHESDRQSRDVALQPFEFGVRRRQAGFVLRRVRAGFGCLERGQQIAARHSHPGAAGADGP